MVSNLASMTGYGHSDGTLGATHWVWELKSVNGRSLDLRIRMPQAMDMLEAPVREILGKSFTRGALQANLILEGPERPVSIRLNEQLLQQVLNLTDQISNKGKVQPPSLDGLLSIRGMMELSDTQDSAADQQKLRDNVLDGLRVAIDDLQHSRRSEGAIIAALFIAQLETISELVAAAEAHPSRMPQAIQKRLAEQLAPLLENSALDPARLHQEAIMIATRVDIREEIDRLKAHVSQAKQLMGEGGAIGRRLDFLAQEFNREANTLCSKSHDKDLTAIGLSLKNIIDQLREQAQNIE